jgi:hypothetical protein
LGGLRPTPNVKISEFWTTLAFIDPWLLESITVNDHQKVNPWRAHVGVSLHLTEGIAVSKRQQVPVGLDPLRGIRPRSNQPD